MEHRLNDMIYLHYGHDTFDIDLFYKQMDVGYKKPKYGLWGCPLGTCYYRLKDVAKLANNPKILLNPSLRNWKWFRETSTFETDKHFYFCLTKNARILIIEHITDITPYCIMNDLKECLIERGYINREDYKIEKDLATTINFDKIKKDGYDGMFVYHNGTELYKHTVLGNWETDSIVVWNPKVIRIGKSPFVWKDAI